jgi:hypothetical protein
MMLPNIREADACRNRGGFRMRAVDDETGIEAVYLAKSSDGMFSLLRYAFFILARGFKL